MAKEGVNIYQPAGGVKIVTASGTPEQLMSKGLAQSIEFQAQKAQFTDNAGDVAIGWSSTNGEQYRTLSPGDPPFTIEAPYGSKLDLSTFYIDVMTNGDGVTYVYLP